MTVYTVHEPLQPASAVIPRADEILFVPEGFSFAALIIGLPWLLFRGLWLELLVLLSLGSVLTAGMLAAGASQDIVSWVLAGLNILLAFEIYNLERWKLERKGYKLIAMTSGANQEEAERRFFQTWLPGVKSEWEARSEGKPWSAIPAVMQPGRARINEPVIGFLTTPKV